jgi:hypothetical protein
MKDTFGSIVKKGCINHWFTNPRYDFQRSGLASRKSVERGAAQYYDAKTKVIRNHNNKIIGCGNLLLTLL